MEFTGERYVPALDGQIKYEHLHRYALSLPLARGKSVLDIACGEGYGSALLAQVAESVVGVDIDATTLNYARQRYYEKNLTFIPGSCESIPLPDKSVEVVASFETIEHHDKHQEMMLEIKRVLKPGGLLIISSPNRFLYSDQSNYVNEHHVKELYYDELKALLDRHFNHVAYYGQRLATGSFVFPLGSASASQYKAYSGDARQLIEQVCPLPAPLYFIAVCSDASLPEALIDSVYMDSTDDLLQKLEAERLHHINQLELHVQGLTDTIAAERAVSQNQRAELATQLTTAQAQLTRQEADLEGSRKQLAIYEAELGQRASEITEAQTQIERYEGQAAQSRDLLSDYEAQLQQQSEELTRIRAELLSRQKSLSEAHDVARGEKDRNKRLKGYVISDDAVALLEKRLGESEENNRSLSAQLSAKTTEVDRIIHSFGWQVLKRYGRVKYRFLLPVYRALRLPPYSRTTVRSSPPVQLPPENAVGVKINSSTEPLLSVIIPVFNQCRFTIGCLNSIKDALELSPLKIEVIVVDDQSTDQTKEVLGKCIGICTVTNEENVGFIDSCNRGAAVARGEYLLFLNNDTLVSPRCFEELLATFQIRPAAGLVGAKLLYPDGTLQEAGGVIWKDASGWNFGRLDDSEKPEYCYLREVDYCSGACIMVPRQLFKDLGGFDTRYRPAYYEDADLAFQIRQAGYRVYYQPLAQVTHFEGVTSGTDISAGVKNYQVVNQFKFEQKWADVLARHGEPGEDVYAAKERQVRKRILLLDACVLTPDQDAGSLMVFNHIKIFQSLGYKVTFAPANLLRDEKYTADLQRIGVECLYWPQTASIKSHLEAVGSYYDLVFVTRAEVAESYIDAVRAYCRRARIIFHTVDLHFVREQRRAELENNPRLAESALRRKEQELTLADKSDCTLVVSAYERDVLLKENPRLNVGVVPMALDLPGPQADFSERSELLFIGGFQHTPNVDAVLYFVQSIYPLIKLQLPDVNLNIVGSRPPAEILDLASDSSIVVTGYVPDVAPYFNRCRLSVAPLRYGAGLKGKVITSLSYGVPLVASAIACEGIGLQDGIDALIADEPLEFAEKVVRLYTDAMLWDSLSTAGFKKVSREYSEAATSSFFDRLFVGLDSEAVVQM